MWRYMDLTRFMALLDSSSLFFCRADYFDDPFEGSLAAANVVKRDELGASAADGPGVEARYRKMREWTAINCWSCIAYESAAMWSLYCPSGAGLAVRTTFRRLCSAFKDSAPWNVVIGEVNYLDYEHAIIPDQHHLAPFLHKRQSFEHEHEVRAIVQRHLDHTRPDRPSPFERSHGINVKVRLDELIEGIYISPTAPTWYSDLVRSIAKRYKLNAGVEQSRLAGDPIY
jgi:hypothetical protein